MVLLLPAWATQSKKYTIPVTRGATMPQSVLAQPPDLSVTGYRIAWAAITSGRPPRYFPSVLTLAGREYRSWRIWASLGLLEDDGTGKLRRTQEFAALDPTEKGHLNYALAGAITKAYAAEKLQSPWLAHLSLAKPTGHGVTYDPNKPNRPDYFGVTASGDFFIAEAKGRVVVRKDLRDALDGKKQTGAVTHVAASSVLARFGFAVTANATRVALYATDPEVEVEIEVTAQDWLRRYYRMVVQVADAIAQVPQSQVQTDDDLLRNWRGVDLFVPSMLREWADGSGDPFEQWEHGEFLSALEYPTNAAINPDLTAFVNAAPATRDGAPS